jgi:CrcB protein
MSLAPWTLFLVICLAGALGSGARYLVATGMLRWVGPRFPAGTLAVNLSGSFLLAVLMELALRQLVAPDLRAILGTGVLGGFTTYSSFNQEALGYFERGAWFLGAAYIVATVVGCVVAGLLGLGWTGWLAGARHLVGG